MAIVASLISDLPSPLEASLESRSSRHLLSADHPEQPPSWEGGLSPQDAAALLSARTHCPPLANLTYHASGWTKAVYRGAREGDGRAVALKVVNERGRDMRQCEEGQPGGRGAPGRGERGGEGCLRRATNKFIREALLLMTLNCSHVVELLGVCDLPSSPPRSIESAAGQPLVSIVTALGEGVDIIRLLQMPWEERLRMSHGVTELLHCLAHSPYGSLALNDFRLQQFVLLLPSTPGGDSREAGPGEAGPGKSGPIGEGPVGAGPVETGPGWAGPGWAGRGGAPGDITLIDVDDVGFVEPGCASDADCRRELAALLPEGVPLDPPARPAVPCVARRCVGLNELKNIASAAREFLGAILPPGAPAALRSLVNELVAAYSGATQRTDALLRRVRELATMYGRGDYRPNVAGSDSGHEYAAQRALDLPGAADYRCRYRIASPVCTVSVLDAREAAELCDLDPPCGGFVLSLHQRSWTGRYYAHLKSNVSSSLAPSINHATALYIRRTTTERDSLGLI